VLNTFCDGDEDIQQISKLTDDAARCGVTISDEEIIQALRELIELGYAKAWDFQPRKPEPPKEYGGMPPIEEITPLDPCFLGTPEGLEFYKSRSFSPPFYWNGRLHKEWAGPEASLPRQDLIRMLILASIWDSYTTLGFIEMRMNDLALRYSVTISPAEIIQALGELIELGYAKAGQLDRGDPPREYDGMPPVEDIIPWRAYFWVTTKGLEFHNTNSSWWPFDDDDNLRKDWTPPDA
jgi:hypothetical protein